MKPLFENTERILLGPVSANPAFHALCREHGAVAVCVPANTELIKENTIIYIDQKITKKKLTEYEKSDLVIGFIVTKEIIKDVKTKKPIISWKSKDKGAAGYALETPEKEAFLIIEDKTPEEIHQLIKDSGIQGIIINSVKNPVIFEQYTNYVEKGYYNKVTRKRREKLANEFEVMSKKMNISLDRMVYQELRGE
jgi:hypothetical protein